MTQQGEEHAPVEEQGEDPQPFFPLILDVAVFGELCLAVAEEGTENGNFEDHADNHPGAGGWVVDRIGLDKVERLFLTAGCDDVKWNWRFCPFNDAADNTYEEERDCKVWKDDPEEHLQTCSGYPNVSDCQNRSDNDNCNN